MIPIFFALTAALTPINELPYAPESLVYQSVDEIQSSGNAFEASIGTTLDQFVSLSQAGRYEEAYQLWSGLQFRLFSFGLKLSQTQALSLNDQVKAFIPSEQTVLKESFQKKLSGYPDLLTTFLRNAQAAAKLTPQQRLFTENILKEYQVTHPKDSQRIAAALKTLSTYKKDPFAFFQTAAKPLDPTILKEVRVLTANIICFPDTLTYLFGGISPWKKRVDQLMRMIGGSDAEIVCLQEVWDPEAMRALIERLKGDYAYFIYNAGDPAGTIDANKSGYSSGLFIASKLFLSEVAFKLFKRSIPEGSNRGMLSATCQMGKDRVCFITTHLQHGNTPIMQQVRKEQLHQCHALLEQLVSQSSSPSSWGFLTGDLNINAFIPEFTESGLSTLFSIPYTANLSQEQKEKATCTDYFNDLVRTPIDQRDQVKVSYELLDYCISPVSSKVAIKSVQKLIPLFSIEAPDKALSDHQALLTTWVLEK